MIIRLRMIMQSRESAFSRCEPSFKMNGKKGDHPIADIVKWKITVFSPTADALIAEIVQLGAQQELETTFNVFAPPALPEFEARLKEMRDRIYADRKHSGWEV